MEKSSGKQNPERKREQFSKEFKLEAIRLYESSQKSAAQIEADLDLPGGMIHKWRRRYQGQGPAAFVGKGHQNELEAEIKRLRRELEVAGQERDSLKAAVIFFSKEQS